MDTPSITPERPLLILGAGYTGSRVAGRLMARGYDVRTVSRTGGGLRLDLEQPEALARLRVLIEPGMRVLHSIPVLAGGADRDAAECLRGAARVVYLSTTGVYGDAREVDETTPVRPRSERQRARVETEQAVLGGPWSGMVLRPAAIYGPGRGVHAAMARGEFFLAGDGRNFVSRIHVDDLAAVAEEALLCDVEGGWPVADEHPCASREIAEFCASLLGVPVPESRGIDELSETRRANRRVNGSAILRRLGVTLRYPSYREGIPASL